MDDRIFNVIRKSKFENIFEEERRLFYVAMTRAKMALYLLTEQENESIFVDEIPDKCVDRLQFLFRLVAEEILLCPSCSLKVEPAFNYCPYCKARLG